MASQSQLLLFTLLLFVGSSASSDDYVCPDEEPVQIGKEGGTLRARIVGKECPKDKMDQCTQKFDISLARGELHKDDGIDMRLYGSQLCERHTSFVHSFVHGKVV